MDASQRAVLYDTFDIKHKPSTGYIKTPYHSTPVTQYFWIKSKEINEQVDVCSFVSPIHDVALFRQSVDFGEIGYQTAQGFRHGSTVTIPSKDPNLDLLRASLVQRCGVAARSPEFAMTAVLALAQEIFQGSYLDVDIEQCYRVLKHMVVGNIQPSRYKTAFKIQYMFFMTDGRNHTNAADIETYLKNMEYTKRLIFTTLLQSTDELDELTVWSLRSIIKVLNDPIPTSLTYNQGLDFQLDLRKRIRRASMDLMNLHEKIGVSCMLGERIPCTATRQIFQYVLVKNFVLNIDNLIMRLE
ncbi:hypothetical protein RRG08_036811 [Elysia crispata]|uniref:Uncharacterized protein n=1 Tax=Elysia crispata TaxID=231223 RepID=A0AAE1ACZ8_9GAST|nr:hypothetical protein RRG08_036811 [Elysia crispata]